jgi:hypothetical protein
MGTELSTLSATVDLTDIKPYSKDLEQQVYRAFKFPKNSNRHSLTRASELEKQFDAVEHFLKLRDSGQTWVEASERTGEKYAVSGKTVQGWVARYKPILEAEIPTTLAS